ncbi:ATP-binding domain-containing protein [Pelobacter propionicus]|uniref:DNA 3'-5' helicase II n=1 Tax=Pelobacter propionicus (strain DSM 2379 / NBRC 103807 / OttBd1) TaxID=338966 RepID=A1AS15_PELPD|nr:ATP-binding domain-containing protein [Pelobacter propionicus]ABL00136.1 superfamily I DNA and RNA helicases-like protein [Pelobacter propionicus DSM 2379]
MNEQPPFDIVLREQQRLSELLSSIEETARQNRTKIANHETYMAELKKERLDSVSWREKNSLTEKLIENDAFDPAKYLASFQMTDSPYFGIVGINDCDRRLGAREYRIGKQGFVSHDNRALVVDWRKAPISRFFYDYELGDEYCETIQGKEREGVITRRDTVEIAKRRLRRMECGDDVFELAGGGWVKNPKQYHSTTDTKLANQDHRMVDIVSLISPDQFHMITAEATDGCTLITGGAGSGKTVVSLHRLSCLQFNDPDRFTPERCLVLMFNKVLRNYVRQTSADLLGTTRVDTFSAWALSAITALTGKVIKPVVGDALTARKKSSRLSALLARYVREVQEVEPLQDLWRFYGQPYVLDALFVDGTGREEFLADLRLRYSVRSQAVSFADLSVLLRLCQLRENEGPVREALDWYAHIIVDEGQDLSLLELEAILAATDRHSSITLSADSRQKILSWVDAADFDLFRTNLKEVGVSNETLSVSYRCPTEIMALAARISNRDSEQVGRHSGALEYHRAEDEEGALALLRRLVEQLTSEDRNSLTAVICKKKSDEKMLHKALAGIPGLHQQGELTFEPGALVTIAHQVKGVEFANVILYDPNSRNFRKSALDRNLLYVCVTRASRRLDIVYWRELAAGLA